MLRIKKKMKETMKDILVSLKSFSFFVFSFYEKV